ncbi:MAG: hypothetical protein NUV52_03790, partial [Candidatus Roizmanbacteria bacterium]|nr:hypothetical protein [Candidatus Roizmanbacteria bacterium]
MLSVVLIISTIILAFILYRAAHYLVIGIREVSRTFTGTFFLAALATGIATAIPELSIGISSAVTGNSMVGFANALGSNTATIGLILPLAALASGMVVQVRTAHFSRKTTMVMLTAALFPFLCGMDGTISRIDGLFLLFLFFVYGTYLFHKRPKDLFGFKSTIAQVRNIIFKPKLFSAWTLIVIAILILGVASYAMVQNGILLSEAVGVSPFLVGLFLLAPGSALPELFIALIAIQKRQIDVLYGDIFASLITNANLVVGLIAVISPIRVIALPQYLMAIIF